MAIQNINIGTTPNDGTGDDLRTGGQKINANFTELENVKLDSVVGGTDISIDNTDPKNPIINSTGSGLENVVGVRLSSDETLNSASENQLSLDTVEFGDASLFNTTNYEYTVPSGGDGRYCLVASFALSTLGNGITDIKFAKNDVTNIASSNFRRYSDATLRYETSIITIDAVAGDKLSVYCRPSGGGNQAIRAGDGSSLSNEFVFYKLY